MLRTMVFVETGRLLLRQWKDEDLPYFIAMNSDLDVMRYFPTTLTREKSRVVLKVMKSEIEERRFGLWAVERKEDGHFIGFVGLHQATFESHFTPCIEVAWRLRKEYWKLGYATEAAQASIRYGFGTIGLNTIYSFTAVVNEPSQAVMKRLGMIRVGEFMHPALDEDSPLYKHILYRISRGE